MALSIATKIQKLGSTKICKIFAFSVQHKLLQFSPFQGSQLLTQYLKNQNVSIVTKYDIYSICYFQQDDLRAIQLFLHL